MRETQFFKGIFPWGSLPFLRHLFNDIDERMMKIGLTQTFRGPTGFEVLWLELLIQRWWRMDQHQHARSAEGASW